MASKSYEARIDRLVKDIPDYLSRYEGFFGAPSDVGPAKAEGVTTTFALNAEDRELKLAFKRLGLDPRYAASWRILAEVLCKAWYPRRGPEKDQNWTPTENEQLRFYATEVQQALRKQGDDLAASRELAARREFAWLIRGRSQHTIRRQLRLIRQKEVPIADEIFKSWNPDALVEYERNLKQRI